MMDQYTKIVSKSLKFLTSLIFARLSKIKFQTLSTLYKVNFKQVLTTCVAQQLCDFSLFRRTSILIIDLKLNKDKYTLNFVYFISVFSFESFFFDFFPFFLIFQILLLFSYTKVLYTRLVKYISIYFSINIVFTSFYQYFTGKHRHQLCFMH